MFRSLVFTALASPHALMAANDELASPADRAAIMMTVRQMLDCLRQGEAQTAFGLLSEEFQSEMITAKRFLSSMRRGCKPLCQSRFIEFDALNAVNGLLVQEISLIGIDGCHSTAYFLMEHAASTGWQVGSCIVDSPQAVLQA